jgi:fibronectin type 3 domain-containing protein
MTNRHRSTSAAWILLIVASALSLLSCGGSSGGGGGQQVTPPATPTGLAATAGNAQVNLTWNASTGATSYNVGRGTASGGPYSTTFSSSTTSYTDATAANGTTYYYVVAAVNSAGTSANSSQVSAAPVAPAAPPTPTGLAATAGNNQVSLTWNASTGATSYTVGRGTASGGPYSTTFSASTTSYTDTTAVNGTTYYYVVAAVNSTGTSANSSQVSATPESANTTNIQTAINVLADRHTISPYIYGGAFPQDTAHITDSGLTAVRWGGNAASTYNWQLQTYNADNDYYFEDFNFFGLSGPPKGSGTDGSSTQFITDVKAAGGNPLMTMVMLQYVAQSAEVAGTGGNGHWSFSVARDGQQCQTDPYNSDAGDGIAFVSGCPTNVPASPTYLTATATDLDDAYFSLLDDHTQTCTSGTCVYRDDWATVMATAFGNTTCSFPYYPSITSCHFYDMDNEIDIWGSTHRDVHPDPTTYDELSNIYLTEAVNLKGWDPQAVRLGWVSCCWEFYWNSAAGGTDKSAHANIDFMPWWLNQIAWNDAVNSARSLDIFDVHAYPETSSSGLTTAQAQALTLSSTRDWWDPTYTSQAWFGSVNVTTNQPLPNEPFRIPRLRAMANMIYPGTPLSFTEWNFGTLGDTDFSTALSDVDAYGILGRERMSLASRWEAASPSNPNYLSLKLFTNYDGNHHGFGTISVSDTNNGNPSLFSSYAALNSAGTTLTIVVLNKDPANAAQVTFTTTGFTPTTVTTHTLSQSSPSSIIAGSSQSWPSTMTFAPYTATLMVVSGSLASAPASAWDLNPDTVMVAANGTVTLHPKITSGSANVTLSSAVFDSFEGATTCTGGTLTLTTSTITPSTPGQITVSAGSTPGFCHFTATGSDSGATQTEGGWIVVGNPAATLAKSGGDAQTGPVGTVLPTPLAVTLTPDPSGGTNTGASVLFTTSAGTLSNGITSGSQVIAVTNSSGVASVTLTLPSTTQTVTVNAEGPYGLGHPVAPAFTETAQ